MPVRTVKASELDRMKKRGGVKVKRKLGTGQKKPEPEIKEEALALSGANTTELPSAPALPSSSDTLLEKVTSELSKLTNALGKVAIEKPTPAPALEIAVKPKISAPVILPKVLTPVGKMTKKRAEWVHTPVRNKAGYLEQINSTDGNGSNWIHKIKRSKQNLIAKVLSSHTD